MNINEKVEIFYDRMVKLELENFEELMDFGANESAIKLQCSVIKRLLNEMNNFYIETYCNDEL